MLVLDVCFKLWLLVFLVKVDMTRWAPAAICKTIISAGEVFFIGVKRHIITLSTPKEIRTFK
jgi:hypothetical protein